jgi:hypothetical protein
MRSIHFVCGHFWCELGSLKYFLLVNEFFLLVIGSAVGCTLLHYIPEFRKIFYESVKYKIQSGHATEKQEINTKATHHAPVSSNST